MYFETKRKQACEAGDGVKPGAQAPGQPHVSSKPANWAKAVHDPHVSVARFAGSILMALYLGLTPQALRSRLLRKLRDAIRKHDHAPHLTVPINLLILGVRIARIAAPTNNPTPIPP